MAEGKCFDSIGESEYWESKMETTNNFTVEVVSKCVSSRLSFYAALSRFCSMPHLTNTRVLGAELIHRDASPKFLEKPLNLSELEIVDKLMHSTDESQAGVNDGVYVIRRNWITKDNRQIEAGEIWDFKNDHVKLYQPVITRSTNHTLAFMTISAQLTMDTEGLSVIFELKGDTNLEGVADCLHYYTSKAVPKIFQWMKENNYFSPQSDFCIPKCSLQLIEKNKYWNFYDCLKKYYLPLQAIWIKLEEPTDPQKMIHEEMGIAAYLVTLWLFSTVAPGKAADLNFIDMGCGNGLLTMFLELKGFSGKGIDMRMRKLWSCIENFTFPKIGKHLDILEKTILPGNTEFISESSGQWLIGNHSDELTPWIPIWARQNKASFFVLPCCAFDFSGKYQKKKGDTKSVFSCYISFIKEIIENCGYNCYIDRLQIPSTKRVCLIGSIHHPNSKSEEEVNDYIASVLDQHVPLFNVRSQQKVRNCTQLSSPDEINVVDKMCKYILVKLVEVKNYIKCPGYFKEWNQGMEKLSLEDAVNLLPETYRELLKQQGKGIQTLIKNHSQIFILKNGFVSLRPPSEKDILSKKNTRIRTKLCLLEMYHPDGCPMPSELCSYRHIKIS